MGWCGFSEPPLNNALVFALISVSVGLIVGIALYLWRKRRAVIFTDIDPPDKS